MIGYVIFLQKDIIPIKKSLKEKNIILPKSFYNILTL